VEATSAFVPYRRRYGMMRPDRACNAPVMRIAAEISARWHIATLLPIRVRTPRLSVMTESPARTIDAIATLDVCTKMIARVAKSVPSKMAAGHVVFLPMTPITTAVNAVTTPKHVCRLRLCNARRTAPIKTSAEASVRIPMIVQVDV